MKAAIYYGQQDIRVADWPEKSPGEKEVLIKVAYCAVCGTDVRIFFHGHKKVTPPAIIGHEITGVVEKIGKGVDKKNFQVGDAVTVVTSVGCGKCALCRRGRYNLCLQTRAIGYYWPGGFARYLIVPEEAVQQEAIIKLPDGVSLLQGSMIEPLSCVINGQNYLEIKEGETVVIFGGGPIGLMHASLAKAKGATTIVIDPDFDRLVRFGQNFAGLILWNPGKINLKQEIWKMTSGLGADVVITACPVKQAQLDGLDILAPGGRLSLFGGLPRDDSLITIDANLIHYKEISVFGAFASNRKDYLQAASLISSGKIPADRFITRVFPLEEITRAISMVKKGEVLKAVIKLE